MSVEREVKLRFDSPVAARAAVAGVGASPLRRRRLQTDALLDTDDGRLQQARCTLRIRTEPDTAFLTFKGAPQPSTMKLREEIETVVADAGVVLAVLERLGFQVWFRYQKYREEFSGLEAILAVDETPIGTFVEIEGTDAGITDTAAALGRGPEHFILDSYRALFVRHCADRGLPAGDMIFAR